MIRLILETLVGTVALTAILYSFYGCIGALADWYQARARRRGLTEARHRELDS